MKPRYFRWSQDNREDDSDSSTWFLKIELIGYDEWDLKTGHTIEKWDLNTLAYYDDRYAEQTDFPSTRFMLPVYSSRLKSLVQGKGVVGIQYLPLKIRHSLTSVEIYGYHLVNYLKIVDCLDRVHSVYGTWTKDNLLFWEKRPWMLGTFRDVKRVVLDPDKIGDAQLFRLWGWEDVVIIRDDLKYAIEETGISGCWFTELALSE